MADKAPPSENLMEGHRSVVLAENVGPEEQVRFERFTDETFEQFLDELESGKGTGELLLKDPNNPDRNMIFTLKKRRGRK